MPQDLHEAPRWYRKAADHGLPDAQVGLGYLCIEDKAVPRGHAQPVAWFQKAGDQSDAFGGFSLGEMYRVGAGVPRDDKRAFHWFSKGRRSRSRGS